MGETPMGFWGLIVEPEKLYSQEVPVAFKMTMAALGPDAYESKDGKNKRAFVMLTHEKNGEFVLCTLCPNEKDNEHLNHVFAEGETIHIRIVGDVSVHLTGYYLDMHNETAHDHDHGYDSEELEAEENGEDIEMTDDEEEDEEDEDYESEDDDEEEEEDEEVDSDEYGATDEEMSPRIREIKSDEELLSEDEDEEDDSEYDDDDLSEADMTPSDEEYDSEDDEFDSEDEMEEDDEEEDSEEEQESEEEEAETFVSKNKRTIVPDNKSSKKQKVEEEPVKSIKKIEITEPKKSVKEEKKAPEVKAVNNDKKTAIQSPPQSSAVTPVKDQKASKQETPKTEAATPKVESPASAVKVLPSGLKIEEVKVGAGIKAQKGRTVGVTYTITDESGQVIASNKNKDSLVFNLSERQVLPALSIGIQGMALGGERKITVPASMVETNSQPAIPKKGTCVIHVTLDNVQNKK